MGTVGTESAGIDKYDQFFYFLKSLRNCTSDIWDTKKEVTVYQMKRILAFATCLIICQTLWVAIFHIWKCT